MPGEERNSWLRSSKSLNLRHPNGEAKQASTVFPCDQCDYLGASETGLKQHVTMKHKKAEGTPALRSQEESSRSVIGSPLPLHNREENCQNCDGTFSPGHQWDESEDDDGLSDSEVRKKKVMKPQNPLWSHCSGHCLHLNVQHLMCFRNWIPTISIKYELNAMWWPICQFGRRHIRLWKVYLSKTILYLPMSPE